MSSLGAAGSIGRTCGLVSRISECYTHILYKHKNSRESLWIDLENQRLTQRNSLIKATINTRNYLTSKPQKEGVKRVLKVKEDKK